MSANWPPPASTGRRPAGSAGYSNITTPDLRPPQPNRHPRRTPPYEPFPATSPADLLSAVEPQSRRYRAAEDGDGRRRAAVAHQQPGIEARLANLAGLCRAASRTPGTTHAASRRRDRGSPTRAGKHAATRARDRAPDRAVFREAEARARSG